MRLLPWRRRSPPAAHGTEAEQALAESRQRLERAQAEQRRHAELRDRNNVTMLVRQLIEKHGEQGQGGRSPAAG